LGRGRSARQGKKRGPITLLAFDGKKGGKRVFSKEKAGGPSLLAALVGRGVGGMENSAGKRARCLKEKGREIP